MMFLQSLPLGAWGVTIGTYIAANTGDQGTGAFAAGFIGYSTAAGAVGGLVAPVLIGALSDRRFASQHLLALMHAGCAASSVSMAMSSTQVGLFVALLAFFHCYAPAVALGNKIGLRHLNRPDAEFPLVRVFGAVGWITAGLFIGLVCPWLFGESIEPTRIPFLVGAVADVAMVIYALTLPSTPPEEWNQIKPDTSRRRSSIVFTLLANRRLLYFLSFAFLACLPSMAYNNFANPFLNLEGYPAAAALMTAGQISEMAVLALMPWLIGRLGLRWLFALGIFAWFLRYAGLSLGAWSDSPLPVYAAILLHGPCFAFVYVGGPMCADRLVSSADRGLAQGLYAVAATGFGHLAGAFLAGRCQVLFLTPEGVSPPPYDWPTFWLVPALLSLVTAAVFTSWVKNSTTS